MHSEFLLERREGAVERVGGVGDIEFRIFLIREEMWEVCGKRSVRTAYVLVSVVPVGLAVLES